MVCLSEPLLTDNVQRYDDLRQLFRMLEHQIVEFHEQALPVLRVSDVGPQMEHTHFGLRNTPCLKSLLRRFDSSQGFCAPLIGDTGDDLACCWVCR
jgi:hypothetical protein